MKKLNFAIKDPIWVYLNELPNCVIEKLIALGFNEGYNDGYERGHAVGFEKGFDIGRS